MSLPPIELTATSRSPSLSKSAVARPRPLTAGVRASPSALHGREVAAPCPAPTRSRGSARVGRPSRGSRRGSRRSRGRGRDRRRGRGRPRTRPSPCRVRADCSANSGRASANDGRPSARGSGTRRAADPREFVTKMSVRPSPVKSVAAIPMPAFGSATSSRFATSSKRKPRCRDRRRRRPSADVLVELVGIGVVRDVEVETPVVRSKSVKIAPSPCATFVLSIPAGRATSRNVECPFSSVPSFR